MASITKDEFVFFYNKVINQLNSAKALQDRYKGGKSMTIEDMAPGIKNKIVFWNKLEELTSDIVKSLYDLSITCSHGLIDVLAYMNTEQHACAWVNSQGKYWICDIDKQRPIEKADYDRLLTFMVKLVRSNKMHPSLIARHKRTKTKTWARSHVHVKMVKAVEENDQCMLAYLAAVFVWMCETRNMNLAFEVQNSAVGSMVFNRSTILARKGDWKAQEPQMAAISEESDEEEAKVHPMLEQKEEDIPDNWEDLEF